MLQDIALDEKWDETERKNIANGFVQQLFV
jgi:hypothetical protein